MNEEEFTGLDVVRAMQDLDNFNDSCRSVETALIKTFADLFGVLYEKWASPNAVSFCNEQIPIISEEITNYMWTYKHILSGANSAAISLANVHGSSMPAKYINKWDAPFNLAVKRCEENKNGVTGMAKENVKIALDIFNDEKNKVLSMLRSLPTGISFYDPAGHLLNTYNKGINEFAEKFNQTISSLTSKLETYIETEIENIILAKEKAEQELSA